MPEDEAEGPGPDAEGGVNGEHDVTPESVSEWTREWLEARAAEQGVSPGELLKRFAAAFRAAEEGDIPDLAYRDDVSAIDEELEALASELDDVERSVEELDEDVSDKIQDVRERVIQVKREVDAKAPADHTHPELAERVASVAESASETRDELAVLSKTVEELDTKVDDGFENFEEILEYLTDAVDDVEARNDQLAGAVVSMRETVRGIAEREGRQSATDRLREQANEHGIRTADCGDCGAVLDIALLTDARCPHCKSTFASVEPKRGFFGSPTLEVGDRPALEAGDVSESDGLTGATSADASAGADAGAVADGNGESVDGPDLDAIRESLGGTAGESPDGSDGSGADDR